MKIAVQLWSLRNSAKDSLSRTLAGVGKLGFDGIEFWGSWSESPEAIAKICADSGVAVAGAHVDYDSLFVKPLEAAVDYHQKLGNTRLICPMLPEKLRPTTASGWSDWGKRLGELSQKLKAHGMLTGFHNHQWEFQRVDGKVPWQEVFDAAPLEVIMQMDVGNAASTEAGKNPLEWLERYPGRAKSIHIKDWSPNGPVLTGDGVVPLADVVRTCQAQGTEWYVIEQEIPGMPELDCVGQCLEKLRGLASPTSR